MMNLCDFVLICAQFFHQKYPLKGIFFYLNSHHIFNSHVPLYVSNMRSKNILLKSKVKNYLEISKINFYFKCCSCLETKRFAFKFLNALLFRDITSRIFRGFLLNRNEIYYRERQMYRFFYNSDVRFHAFH